MTEPRDRFDPQTGQPIDYPSEPEQPYSSDATHTIAPPGTIHPDYTTRRVAEEPRDVLLSDPVVRHVNDRMSVAQRIAAKARAQDDALIDVRLPDLGETVRARPKSFETVIADVGLGATLSRAAQQSMFRALKDLEALPEEQLVRLNEDPEEAIRKIGLDGTVDLQRVLFTAYPLACLVEPKCVPLASDITDERREIALEWLSQADRNAIVNACWEERAQRTAAVAPFHDAQATA